MLNLYDQNDFRVYYATGTQAIPRSFYGKHYDTWQTKTQKHIFVGSQLVATMETVGTTITPNYVLSDHLGGTTMMTNSSGVIVQSSDYYPHGDIRTNTKTGSFEERKKFTGHTYDAETDLNYMGARYQRGFYGRYLSQDPMFRDLGVNTSQYGKTQEQLLASPQELNPYSYVGNNPIKYIDPTGEVIQVPIVLGLVAMGMLSPTYANAPPVSQLNSSNLSGSGIIIAPGAQQTMTAFNIIGFIGGPTMKTEQIVQKVVTQSAEKIIMGGGQRVATANNYRILFEKAFGKLQSNTQVYHTLPQQFRDLFKQQGINVDQTKYLRAIDVNDHKVITQEWNTWTKENQGNITIQRVQEFANKIDAKYGDKYLKLEPKK